jgi:hypothetical protein
MQDFLMKNEVFENHPDQSDPLIESLGFVGFDSIDLLRFVESEMDAEERAAFLEQVRSGDADAARRLARMRNDHDAMRRIPEAVPGRDLLASVRSRIARGELIEDQLFADPGLEPTDLMSKSIEDLARRRRRDRRRPFEWAAAGITVAMLAGILGSQLLDRTSGERTTTFAADERGAKTREDRNGSVNPSNLSNPSMATRRSTDSDRIDQTPTRLATASEADRAPGEEIERESVSSLASFGLAVAGDGGEEFEIRLASLVLDSNAVLIRNLTLAECMTATGRQFMAALQRSPDQHGSNPRRGSLQPPPIVGMSDHLPDSKTRIDLAERGFRYAIVMPRAKVEGVLARLSSLAGNNDKDGTGARLIPAHTGRPDSAFDLDAWSSWSEQAKARPRQSSPSVMLIVPIAVVPKD